MFYMFVFKTIIFYTQIVAVSRNQDCSPNCEKLLSWCEEAMLEKLSLQSFWILIVEAITVEICTLDPGLCCNTHGDPFKTLGELCLFVSLWCSSIRAGRSGWSLNEKKKKPFSYEENCLMCCFNSEEQYKQRRWWFRAECDQVRETGKQKGRAGQTE